MSNDHRAPADLPEGLQPLLTLAQLMAYYRVSDWSIRKWIKAGMPIEPIASRGFRFDLAKCREWHRENAHPSQQMQGWRQPQRENGPRTGYA